MQFYNRNILAPPTLQIYIMTQKINGDSEFLQTFGFISNEARKNLVVFFLVLLVFSNVFFVYRNIQLENTINKLNQEKLQLSLDLSNKITEEVRKQITPATIRIEEAASKVDSVANETNFILKAKHSTSSK